jgi:hypothetical protein
LGNPGHALFRVRCMEAMNMKKTDATTKADPA